MTIGDNIRRVRTRHNMTQEEFGKLANVSSMAVSQWENDRAVPRMGAVQKIADSFGIPKSEIIDVDTIDMENGDFVSVPLVGSIAAGTPIEMVRHEKDHRIPSELIRRYGKDVFLLKVEGNSMNRVLPNGCYALIDPADREPYDGGAYAVCVNGYNATIKRVRKLANGFELEPDSSDPTYRSQLYDYNEQGTEQVTIIGKVVWYCVPIDFTI